MIEQNQTNQEIRAKLDAACKRALSNRRTLAFLLKECAFEFRDIPVAQIENEYIEGAPEIASFPVHRNIRGAATEDTTVEEGSAYFDIRFLVQLPGGKESIRLIVNVEAQNNFYPGYPLVKRALYYCSRLISSQYGIEFEKSQYERIQKVYSIWICLNPPKERQNTITSYEISERNLIGNVHEPRESYDLQQVVMVCLGKYEEVKDREGVLPLMDALFIPGMELRKRRQVITEQYGIAAPDGQEGDDKYMFDFSDSFYQQGILQGIEQGRLNGIKEGMKQGMEQGRLNGIKEGMKQGMKQGVISTLFKLVNRNVITESQGADEANLPLADFHALLKDYNESANKPQNRLSPAAVGENG